MTTVATDGRLFAGDGLSTRNDSVTRSNHKKVIRLDDGSIIGGSGRTTDIQRAVDALIEGSGAKASGDFNLLRLYPNGRLELYEGALDAPIRVPPPQAIGTGSDLAMGAMLAGVDAYEAVKIASKVDIYTGGKITSFSR